MVTATTYDKCYSYMGLSTDTKPIEGVGNGSTFFEMDTSKAFAFIYVKPEDVVPGTNESRWVEI